MSDGKEQYADSAFNKAAEAAVEEYKKKHYETWHMGADPGAPEGDTTVVLEQQANWQGTVAPNDYRAWTAPRNQYEPLFPHSLQGGAVGASLGRSPEEMRAVLFPPPNMLGTMTGRSTVPAPPQQRPKEGVIFRTPDDGMPKVVTADDTVTITTTVNLDATPERDPNGIDPHTPGAKLDAGKTPLRRGALEQFPRALMAVADVSAYGAAKYTWGGWQTVPDGVQRYLDAGARHAALRAMGESYDKESGLLHLAQEAWNILAALELAMRSDKLGI